MEEKLKTDAEASTLAYIKSHSETMAEKIDDSYIEELKRIQIRVCAEKRLLVLKKPYKL